MLNEMLLLDIHTHEAGTGQSGERPPSDLISRVRGYLEMRLPGKTVHRANFQKIGIHIIGENIKEHLLFSIHKNVFSPKTEFRYVVHLRTLGKM